MRIVSLLPGATEMVCALGLSEQLVGVTHACDYPPDVERLPRVTRPSVPAGFASAAIDRVTRERLAARRALFSVDRALLTELRPDLIITQPMGNRCPGGDEEIDGATADLPSVPTLLNLAPASLETMMESILVLGRATGVEHRAEALVSALRARVAGVAERRAGRIGLRPRTTLLQWIAPLFTAAYWNPHLVDLAGGIEGLAKDGEPSRSIAWQEMASWQPELLVIACCGFAVARTLEDLPVLTGHPGWTDLPCVQEGRVFVVDGASYFSRPGPRLVDSLEILAHLIDPDVQPLPPGIAAPYPVRLRG